MRFSELGELVGRGRTSDVFAVGRDSVVKIPHAGIDDDWPAFEATLTAAVRACGVPAPEVRDVIQVDGRSSVLFERIDGPSMWQQMCALPNETPAMAAELAAIQKALFTSGIPDGVPDLVDRLRRKIASAQGLSSEEKSEATALVDGRARGAALLHGDLHPGNVLIGRRGPVLIDWFDATIGHPIADVVRSSILTRPSATTPATHLPGAPQHLLRSVHSAYLGEFRTELEQVEDLAGWQAVVAAARLSEGAEVDERVLIDLWRERAQPGVLAAIRPG